MKGIIKSIAEHTENIWGIFLIICVTVCLAGAFFLSFVLIFNP